MRLNLPINKHVKLCRCVVRFYISRIPIHATRDGVTNLVFWSDVVSRIIVWTETSSSIIIVAVPSSKRSIHPTRFVVRNDKYALKKSYADVLSARRPTNSVRNRWPEADQDSEWKIKNKQNVITFACGPENVKKKKKNLTWLFLKTNGVYNFSKVTRFIELSSGVWATGNRVLKRTSHVLSPSD